MNEQPNLPEPGTKHSPVWVDYTNYKGERAIRCITPIGMWFGQSQHHEGAQWLLKVFDHDRQAEREYALSGIHGWYPDVNNAPSLAPQSVETDS